MDTMTPPLLHMTRELRWMIGAGKSMREAVPLYIRTNHHELALVLRERWYLLQHGHNPKSVQLGSDLREALWDLIEMGYRGQPVHEAMSALEGEIELMAELNLEAHLQTLPFKVLIPLLFLVFPAYLVLLLGPLLRDLTRQMGAMGIALIALGATSIARADVIDEIYLKKIHSAQSAADVQRWHRDLIEIRAEQLACQRQWQRRQVPTACYRALARETRWGVTRNSHQKAALHQRLDARCALALQSLNSPPPAETQDLSIICRQRLAAAKRVWTYQNEVESWSEN